jgi:hypothetical protein
MRETQVIARIHARKYRIRQRLDRYHYGRKPFRFDRRTALRMAAAFMFLVLCGVAAYWQTESGSGQERYESLRGR